MAWHAVKTSPFKKGDSVLILGGGPIGLAVIQTLVAKGAEKIIVSEVASRRREFAKHFGASTSPTHNFFITGVSGVYREYIGSTSDKSFHRIDGMKGSPSPRRIFLP